MNLKESVLDPYKLMHWFNARKVTPSIVSEKTGIPADDLKELLSGNADGFASDQLAKLADALDVSVEALTRSAHFGLPLVIHASAEEIENTKRPISRDGIHFYNYYTLPSPTGFIAPVILDILCPQDKLPELNNGHLEPAITINLGPGDIHGRWHEELDEVSWRVLGANRSPSTDWIVGESYIEPPYCPHTYGLASSQPAKILSYTVKSNLEELFQGLNNWSDITYRNFVEGGESQPPEAVLLRNQMDKHGYDSQSLGESCSIPSSRIDGFLAGGPGLLELGEIKTLARAIGLDYRLLLEPVRTGDSLGKVHSTLEDSLNTVRPYKSYTVASMASSPSNSDLLGLFIKVAKEEDCGLDLCESGNCHYLVTGGELNLIWEEEGGIDQLPLKQNDALWVGPYVRHAFVGNGSLIKMGNGEGFDYLQQMELRHAHNLAETLTRGRKDRSNWGYEDK